MTDEFDRLFPPRAAKPDKAVIQPGLKINDLAERPDFAYRSIVLGSRCPGCGEFLGDLTDDRRRPIQRVMILSVDAPLDRWTVLCSGANWLHITGSDGIDRLIFLAGRRPDVVRFVG